VRYERCAAWDCIERSCSLAKSRLTTKKEQIQSVHHWAIITWCRGRWS
jgi:hypothetical protein